MNPLVSAAYRRNLVSSLIPKRGECADDAEEYQRSKIELTDSVDKQLRLQACHQKKYPRFIQCPGVFL